MESQRETMNCVTKRRPRLGVTGSAGVGKTSLGRRLAEILAVPFVEEGMRGRIEAGLDMHTLDRDGRRWDLLVFGLLKDEWQDQSTADREADAG